MKKIYSTLLFSLILFSASYSQPVLTSANTNFAIGDGFQYSAANYTSPGNQGANVTWDFSTLAQTNTYSSSIITPSAGTGSANFPNADVCIETAGSTWGYIEQGTQAKSIVGAYAAYAIPYSNPEDLIRYPMAYQSTFTDSLLANFTAATYAYERKGIVTVTADGYGTLILPWGTLNGVLRVEMQEDYSDSMLSINFVTHYTSENYQWYFPGTHNPVLAINSIIATPGGTSQNSQYLVQSSVNRQQEFVKRMVIYPNPSVNGSSVLEFDLENPAEVNLEILDISGKLVYSQTIDASQFKRVELGDYVKGKGVFIVRLSSGDLKAERKLINF